MIETLNLNHIFEPLGFPLDKGSALYYNGISKKPFFVILHSLGKNENDALKFYNFLPKHSTVLSIRGSLPWTVDGDNSFAWFDIKGPFIENFCDETDLKNSINYVSETIDKFRNEHTDLDDPIILGFSQGGIVALSMIVENYYKAKGVFCHCGYYEQKLDKKFEGVETKILMTNGAHDYIIPDVWAKNSMEYLETKCKNFEGKFLECGHEVNETVIKTLQMWLINLI